MEDKILDQIQQIKKRIDKLESAVFSNRHQKKATVPNETKKYDGVKGGILSLIEKGFLKTKSTVEVIKKELEKEEYVYRREVIQTALNRLSHPRGPLVKVDESGKKAYVQRK